jgi:hypothetical protein
MRLECMRAESHCERKLITIVLVTLWGRLMTLQSLLIAVNSRFDSCCPFPSPLFNLPHLFAVAHCFLFSISSSISSPRFSFFKCSYAVQPNPAVLARSTSEHPLLATCTFTIALEWTILYFLSLSLLATKLDVLSYRRCCSLAF